MPNKEFRRMSTASCVIMSALCFNMLHDPHRLWRVVHLQDVASFKWHHELYSVRQKYFAELLATDLIPEAYFFSQHDCSTSLHEQGNVAVSSHPQHAFVQSAKTTGAEECSLASVKDLTKVKLQLG